MTLYAALDRAATRAMIDAGRSASVTERMAHIATARKLRRALNSLTVAEAYRPYKGSRAKAGNTLASPPDLIVIKF